MNSKILRFIKFNRLLHILVMLMMPTYSYGVTYTFNTIYTSTFATYDSSINNTGEIVWYELKENNVGSVRSQLYSNVRGQLTDDSNYVVSPQINDFGQTVWQSAPSNSGGGNAWDIILDGTYITSDATYDGQPRINNSGEVVWGKAGSIRSNLNGEVFSGTGAASPDINNLGEIVFRSGSGDSSQVVSTLQGVLGSGADPRIIDTGEIFWWWDFTIYSSIQGALTTGMVSSGYAVNNNGDIIYQGADSKAYMLRDGIETLIVGDYTRAWGMDINDNGVASFTGEVGDGTYGVFTATVVPVPSAVWLFGSGLITLFGFTRLKSNV